MSSQFKKAFLFFSYVFTKLRLLIKKKTAKAHVQLAGVTQTRMRLWQVEKILVFSKPDQIERQNVKLVCLKSEKKT